MQTICRQCGTGITSRTTKFKLHLEPQEFPLLNYTVQLYYAPKKQGITPHPIPIASGVLIKGKSKYFLVTCTHVFDGIKLDDVVILTSMGFAVRLPDAAFYLNDGDPSIDIALIELKSHRLKELKSHYTFLPFRYIGLSHDFDPELYYMMFGFVSKQTTRWENIFDVESFGYLTNCRHYKNFTMLGFDYASNVSLEYNVRKQGSFTDNQRYIGFRDLKGLSGGGIWLSVPGRSPGFYKYILVGIMIEERKERGFIIGTKINLLQPFIS